jgi:hypothetical protein
MSRREDRTRPMNTPITRMDNREMANLFLMIMVMKNLRRIHQYRDE